MRTKKLIKTFEFSEENRSRIVLGTSVRLNPATNRLELQADSNGSFPTSGGLYAKTWATTPANAKGWLGFQTDSVMKKIDGVPVTQYRFRLGDGTVQRYWNGTTWAVTTTAWNTEEEVANHIASFPVSSRTIQVIANLQTTDSTVTPELSWIKILYASDIEFQEDLVYRTLVRQLRAQVRPLAEYQVVKPTSSSKFVFDPDALDTPYNFVSVDSVFNHTDDSNHLTDLFTSFNPSTHEITLSQSVDAGKQLWIRFIYEPEVAVDTNREYHEVGKVPALVLEDINLENTSEMGPADWVLNRFVGTGVKIPAPLRGDLVVTLLIETSKGVDLQRLADEVKRFCMNNPLITSLGLDEKYRLWMTKEFDQSGTSNQADIHTARVEFRLVNVLYYAKDPVNVFGVLGFHVDGNLNLSIEVEN